MNEQLNIGAIKQSIQPLLEVSPIGNFLYDSLFQYLTNRVSRSELALVEQMTKQANSDEVSLCLSAPSIFGKVNEEWRDPKLNEAILKRRIGLIEESGLFDESFYLEQVKRPFTKKISPIEHYLSTGWALGKDPHPVFSVKFYLATYPDVRNAGIDPLTHYIMSGSSEMRNPHPLFLNYFYASQNSFEMPGSSTWLAKFLSAVDCPFSPHPIFDVDTYAWRARIDTGSAAQALLHYLITGWKQSLDVSPMFSSTYYRSQVGSQIGELEPFTHYTLFGVPRRLDPHPLFDVKYYRRVAKDIEDHLDPLVHFFWKGEASGNSPSPLFDIDFYKKSYSNELSSRGTFWHYLTEGAARDYRPNMYFNARQYRATFMEGESDQNLLPLEHFVTQGLFNISASKLATAFPQAKAATAALVPQFRPSLEHLVAWPDRESGVKSLPEVKAYAGKVAHTDGRPNVLLVAHIASDHLFGSERSLLDMLDGLASFGANVFVALPRHVPEYSSLIKEKCERLLVFKYGWWRKDVDISEEVKRAFNRIIKTNDIQIVHANTIMVRECLDAARDSGVTGVVHIRELITHDQDLVNIIGRSAEDIVATVKERADWVIGNSEATAKAFLKPGMTFVIPNTIDTDVMDISNHLTGSAVRFGLISSNIPKKGILDLVEVARRCLILAPTAQFLVIGPETPTIKDLKAAAPDGTLPSNIAFPGYAATPLEAVSQVNVVLNLSHFAESFGRTVLEAMAARRPVIAYNWGALSELITQGETGYLAPFRDVEAVAAYVKMICDDPVSVETMGLRARHEAVRKYSLPSYRDTFRKAYAEILPKAFLENEREPAEPIIRSARGRHLVERRQTTRIAYFCWHFPVPSETFVLNELRVLVQQGVDVIVFCRQSPHPDFKIDFPVQFERVDSPSALARRLQETSRTIVHAHFTYPTVTNMVWPACEEAQIPFTFIAHAQDIFVYKNDEQNRIGEIGASKWCLKLFTLSRFHHDYVIARGFPRNKVIINPNAVSLERFGADPVVGREDRTSRKIVAIHRFVEKKGIANLIRAASLLKDLNISIEIYGYGPLEDEFRKLVASLKVDNVRIHEGISQDQVVEVLRSADLFACPSIRTETGDMDGIPTSIIESMAAGLPVLTTAISGIPDLVEDGITGIVCEPTPAGIADAIRRFYGMHALQIRAIIDEARIRVADRHDATKLVDNLQRVWENRTVDIVIVAWNNLRELQMVVNAVLENTASPYHLIICDNLSQKENVGQYLDSLWAREEHVTIVHNNKNAMVGPGTNLAMAQSDSDYIIYMCGKEGMSFSNGWELAFVRAFKEPDIGLVGSIGYSPSYLTGADYPKGIKLFDKFRNKEFAADNPNREFGHVQGGLFGISRRMVEEIGGFSEDVPHDYTDVEYSYYAESRGWKLAEADHVLALFNKSRPSLSQRFRDDIKVAHPVLPDELVRFQAVVDGQLRHCNMCDWFGDAFEHDGHCPSCAADPLDRTLFRWLSDSRYLFRRLPALGIGLTGKMGAVWLEQFQGPRLSLQELVNELETKGRLPNSPARLHIAALRIGNISPTEVKLVASELRRVLTPNAKVLVQMEIRPKEDSDMLQELFRIELTAAGFLTEKSVRYGSQAIGYSFVPMAIFAKS